MKLILITAVAGAAGHLLTSSFLENNALHGFMSVILIIATILLIKTDIK